MGIWNNSWRIYSNFPFQFYKSFSISYIEIGVHLNLSQIFVIKLMSGCGKDKYLTEICWKLLTFASKALISSIFPKNVTNFCDFLENTCMYHVFNQKVLPRYFKRAWNCPLFARQMVYFTSPKDLSLFFRWKRPSKGCSELMFIFPLQKLYLHDSFNQKIVHKVV